jgi:ribosome-binding factor A
MSIRTEKVASLIRQEIATIVQREYNSPEYGFITVTDVKMSADLRIAKVSFSILGAPQVQERTMKMLEGEISHIRGIVGSHVRLRFVPTLQFYHDDTLERVDRINRILNKIHEDGHRESEES